MDIHKSALSTRHSKLVTIYCVMLVVIILTPLLREQYDFVASQIFGYLFFGCSLALYLCALFFNQAANKIKVYEFDIIVLLLFACCLLSGILNGADIIVTVRSVLYEFKFIFVFLGLTKIVVNRNDCRFFCGVLLFVIVIQIVMGSIELVGGERVRMMLLSRRIQLYGGENQYYLQRYLEYPVFGTMPNKNYFALLMLWGWFFADLVMPNIIRNKKVNYLLLIITSFFIVISKAKMTWLLFTCVLLIKFRRRAILYFVAPVIFVLLVLGVLGDYSPFKLLLNKDYIYDVRIEGRLALLQATSEILWDKPLKGEGPGKWGSGLQLIGKKKPYEISRFKGYVFRNGMLMDCNWASIAGQFGLVVFIIFVIFLGKIGRFWFVAIYNRNITPFARTVAKFNLVILLCMIIQAFVYPVFSARSISFLFYTTAGISYSFISKLDFCTFEYGRSRKSLC